jgi:subtilisin-like proprotein convertase family protein
MSLEMVLELDENQKVIGGEWVGSSKTGHPDFIWLSLGPDDTGYNTEGTYMTFGDDMMDGADRGNGTMEYTDAPGLAYSNVKLLLAMSQLSEKQTLKQTDGQASDLPEGHVTDLKVLVEGDAPITVADVMVYMDIEANFTPGLKIELVAPDGTSVKILDIPISNQNWKPGQFPVGWDLGVLKGVAHQRPLVDDQGNLYQGLKKFNKLPARGEWTLRINNEQANTAKLKKWSLWLVTEKEGEN